MRVPTIVLIAVAVLLIPEWTEAGEGGGRSKLEPSGQGFLKEKHPKLGKNYYVVHEGQTNQCSIVTGEWANKPVGTLGGAPYATKDYAKAALKTFPECKGGEMDQGADKKHKKK
jgi:hypothetical protein